MKAAALVLAAGSARRFGSDKLSTPLDDEPLLYHAIRAARAAPVDRVIVVTRPGLEIGTWPGQPVVDRIEIESNSLSQSLKAGIAAVGEADAAFVFLGDMPRVPHEIASKLADQLGGNYAAIPRCRDRSGHPVLLSSRAFADLDTITGDQGAGKLLRDRKDIAWMDCNDAGILLDVDKPEDLEQIRRQRS